LQADTNNSILVRQAIDSAIQSLGGPIHKTILWHMNNRGILSDPTRIDIESFYLNLQELVGPGAEMIMEETWDILKKKFVIPQQKLPTKTTPVQKIQVILKMGEGN